jgi:hypothetical protein
MIRKFEELALDVHNCSTRAMYIKISLAFHEMYEAIVPSTQRSVPLLKPFRYNALYIIRNHIHPDLKLKYVMGEEPSTLWAVLQTRYE